MKKIFLCAVALSIFSFDAKAEEKKPFDLNIEDPCVLEAIQVVEDFENSLGIKLSPRLEGDLLLAVYDACAGN